MWHMSHIWMSHVMSFMNESWNICVRHVTYAWGMSHMNELCQYEWVISNMNKSYHKWMSDVTYEWVMSHMNESCNICTSHITCARVTSSILIDHDMWMTHVSETTSICYMIPSYLCTFTSIYMHIYIHVYAHVHIFINIYVYIYIHDTSIYMHIYIHIYAHLHPCICTCTYMYKYIC